MRYVHILVENIISNSTVYSQIRVNKYFRFIIFMSQSKNSCFCKIVNFGVGFAWNFYSICLTDLIESNLSILIIIDRNCFFISDLVHIYIYIYISFNLDILERSKLGLRRRS